MKPDIQQVQKERTEGNRRAGLPPDASRRPTARNRPEKFWLAVSLGAVLWLTLSGCRVAEETVQVPMKAVSAIVPGPKSAQVDPATVQAELQRYADEYASRTAAALDDCAARTGTPEARYQALQWKVSVGSAAVSIASAPNPQANLLDFLALATSTRMFLEQGWLKSTNGPACEPWLITSRNLETNAWKLARGIFSPEQQQELRDSIGRWWEENPDARTSFFVRPQEFSTLIRQTGEKSDRPGSVFALVGLDPTAGLDPAVREVARTRLLAGRAMFMLERMPFLVRWQAELLANDLLRQEQVGAALTSADRLSRAAESASQTAAQLPDRITAERRAVIEALEAQEGRLRELSAEVGRTLTAGEKMSASLNTTITTFDALMKRFGVGEPATAPPDTNSPPFDILNYARTADRIAAMAGQLDALIKDAGNMLDSPALDKRGAELSAMSARARADAKSVLNHAFLLAAGLIMLAFACALLYRRFVPRRTTAHAGQRPAGISP